MNSTQPFLREESISLVSDERVGSVNELVSEAFERVQAELDLSNAYHQIIHRTLRVADYVGWGNSGDVGHLIVQPTCYVKSESPSAICVDGPNVRLMDHNYKIPETARSLLSEALAYLNSGLQTVFLSAQLSLPPAFIAFDRNRAKFLGAGSEGAVFACGGGSASDFMVAVKVPRVSRPDQLEREMRLLCRPRHPCLAVLLSARLDRRAGVSPTTIAEVQVMLAYDLASGGSVADVLEVRGSVAYEVVCSWVVQALRGLRHLHEAASVAHLDIKPANLLLCGGPEAGTPAEGLRICDFGCCAELGSFCAEERGTPLYMSPTQARPQPAGPASHPACLVLHAARAAG